jgi:hypothetical protein
VGTTLGFYSTWGEKESTREEAEVSGEVGAIPCARTSLFRFGGDETDHRVPHASVTGLQVLVAESLLVGPTRQLRYARAVSVWAGPHGSDQRGCGCDGEGEVGRLGDGAAGPRGLEYGPDAILHFLLFCFLLLYDFLISSPNWGFKFKLKHECSTQKSQHDMQGLFYLSIY